MLRELFALRRHLGQIGNNLDQVAKALDSRADAPQAEAVLAAVQRAAKRVDAFTQQHLENQAAACSPRPHQGHAHHRPAPLPVRARHARGAHRPHLVAAWDGLSPDPGRDPDSTYSDLQRLLDQPVMALPKSRRPAEHVWHLSIRAAPEDPILSDEQWGEIARRMVAATGIAPDRRRHVPLGDRPARRRPHPHHHHHRPRGRPPGPSPPGRQTLPGRSPQDRDRLRAAPPPRRRRHRRPAAHQRRTPQSPTGRPQAHRA